ARLPAESRVPEQIAGKLSPGAGQVRPLGAMLRHDAADPQLRAEDEREDEKARDGEEDGHGALRYFVMAGLVPAIPLSDALCPPNRDPRDKRGDDASLRSASILRLDVRLLDDRAELLRLGDHERAIFR